MSLFRRFFGASGDDAKVERIEGFPFEAIRSSGKEAVGKALDLRIAWQGSFTPVILGGEDLGILRTGFEDSERSEKELIELSKGVDLPAWFERRTRENWAEEEEIDPLAYVTNPDAWNMDRGENEILSVKEVLSRKFHREVWIAKVPTGKPFETPAYLRLGGWNECPISEEHVAVWHYWEEQYGAEILCVTGDVIEATVKNAPREMEDCYRLAKEQFAYCSDIVTQGVESIDALAATVRGGKYWYFWWD